ncbi:MAG: arylsulfatase [Acidobacteriota bacterium]
MKRREFLKTASLGAAALALPIGEQSTPSRKPNIIYILADDLGMGEVGCYGQKKIRTPNIDRIAAEGMKFTAHYSGSPVCAPSRCTLLTGLHTGHAYIRDNDEMGSRGDVWHDLSLEGQRPLEAGTVTIGTMLQGAGYKTAAIGKWGLGGPGSTGEPNRMGFDHFYGYLCQRVAHNHYPSYLWRNREKVGLNNEYVYPHEKLPAGADPNDVKSYAKYIGKDYAADKMADEALGFIRDNQARPFFLYLAFTIPHAALQVPEDSLAEYLGQFPETPYTGAKDYLPHRAPRAAYAAMVTRMDKHIGRVMALVKELKLDDNTIVMFTSDNGPTFNGGTDSAFFESAAGLRGLKQDVYEGGIRVPLVARWPGHIPKGQTSAHPSAFWDMMPTFADLAGVKASVATDGVSLVPSLMGQPAQQKSREYLYWEFEGRQAVRMQQWKAVRLKTAAATELFDLSTDPSEKVNVAAAHPEIAKRAEDIFLNGRTESALFPLK